jgi:molybdopterin-guanine dinucleotide biosynthesis protein A
LSKIAHPAPACAGFVLAGGRSSRMGTDKALIELAGRPLVAHALDALRAAGLQPAIAGAHADLSSYAPVVPDSEPDRGPLGGICAALEQCQSEMAIFISVDLPLLPPSAIEYLERHAAITGKLVTVFALNGYAQTFPAVIRRQALATLKAELASGRGGCFAALETAARTHGQEIRILPVEYLAQTGHVRHGCGLSPARWFANLNTPEDLDRVGQWLQAAFA